MATFLVLGLTAYLVVRGVLVLHHSGGISPSIDVARRQLAGPAVLGLLGGVMVAEHFWPAVRRPFLARGHVQDAVYFLFYAVAVVPLVVLIGVGFSNALHHDAPWMVLPALTALPSWTIIAVSLVAIDGCNWLAHWANHRVTALWRLHALHHSQEEMSILTAFRTHPLVHASFLITVVPAVVLLANAHIPAAAIVIYLCLATFPHANLRWGYGPLGRVLVSPSYHRQHHATTGRTNVNFGTVLTVWDVLSHRAIFPAPGSGPIDTGIADRSVPIEQQDRRSLRIFVAQLADPFFSRSSSPESVT